MKPGRLLQERVVAVAVAVAVVLVWTSTASADESLGKLEFSIGQPGAEAFGLEIGAYGALNSGEFPGPLFVDGQPRAVQSIIEADADAWTLAYDGPPDLWGSDLALDRIILTVVYENGQDGRSISAVVSPAGAARR